MNTFMPSITAIRTALALCDKPEDRELPETLADALTIRDNIAAFPPGLPEVHDLVERLADSSPADFDAALDEAATEYSRRAFITATRANGRQDIALNRRLGAAYAEAAPVIAERLRAVFDKAAGELAKAARKLPEGEAALDPQAVLEANAGSPYKVARDAVTTLHTLAQAVTVPLRSDGTTPLGSTVVALVDVPEVEVERLHPLSEARLNQPDALERIVGVRDLVKAYATSPQLTLLDVARDKYPGVALVWPKGPAEVRARVQRVSTAHLIRREREANANAGW